MQAPNQTDSASTPAPTPASAEPAAAPAPETTTAQASPAPDTGVQQAAALTSALAKVIELETQVATAKKESSENYERYLRSVADMENVRRRTARDKEETVARAAARVLEDLLPVIDNLGLGLNAAKAPNADLKTLVGGIGMVAEQLKTTLANHGLKEINPTGQPFDPNLHEAISQVPSATVAEGSVVQVVRIGFTLNNRLLRPASVIISTGPAAEEAK